MLKSLKIFSNLKNLSEYCHKWLNLVKLGYVR